MTVGSEVLDCISGGPPGRSADPARAVVADPSGGPDDAALMAAVAAGDVAALGLFYDRHARFASAVACRLVGDRDAAEDVVHDAFLSVWRGARSYRMDRASARPWLLVIVRNAAVDALRARRTIPIGDGPLPQEPDRVAGVDDLAAAALESDRVREAVAALPPDQRQAVHLAFFAGLTHGEIAARTGLPLGTVKGRLRLALRKLRTPLLDLEPAAR